MVDVGATKASCRATPVFRQIAHLLIRLYQLTLSSVIGRWCRHAPSCSSYMDEAITRHGVWAGGWMGAARLCRCHPWGSSGYDPPPQIRPANARAYAPWRYGDWRGPRRCETISEL